MELPLILQILTGLLVLGAFVAAYFASKTWRITHVVLVMLNFLAMLAFFYLAARTLKTHKSWREAVANHQTVVSRLEAERDAFLLGAKDENDKLVAGIGQLKHQLHKIALARGQAWYGATPMRVDPTGAVQLNVKMPDPHGIPEKAVLFALEQRKTADGGHYLGEFRVTRSDDKGKTVALAPNLPLTPGQLARLAAARGPWALYAIMPFDDAPSAATGSAATSSAVPVALSKQQLDDFLQDKLKLRNFEHFFRSAHHERTELEDEKVKLASRIASLVDADNKLKQDHALRQSELTKLQADLEKFRGEREAVVKLLAELNKHQAQAAGELAAALTACQKLSAELVALQTKAADQIKSRSAAGSLAQEQPAK